MPGAVGRVASAFLTPAQVCVRRGVRRGGERRQYRRLERAGGHRGARVSQVRHRAIARRTSLRGWPTARSRSRGRCAGAAPRWRPAARPGPRHRGGRRGPGRPGNRAGAGRGRRSGPAPGAPEPASSGTYAERARSPSKAAPWTRSSAMASDRPILTAPLPWFVGTRDRRPRAPCAGLPPSGVRAESSRRFQVGQSQMARGLDGSDRREGRGLAASEADIGTIAHRFRDARHIESGIR